MSTESNKEVVRRWIEETYGKGNVELQRQLMYEDIVDHNPMPGAPPGIEGQILLAKLFAEAFAIDIHVDLLLSDGDFVMDRWTAHLTHRADFFGIPASGKRATITGIDISRLRDGKIAEVWHLEDVMGLMQQLGAIPAPAG